MTEALKNQYIESIGNLINGVNKIVQAKSRLFGKGVVLAWDETLLLARNSYGVGQLTKSELLEVESKVERGRETLGDRIEFDWMNEKSA